jgi:predicted XRE-type DNA-binding protein
MIRRRLKAAEEMWRDNPGTIRPDERDAVAEGSGNVFVDLGFADAEELLAKAELARCIAEVIAERKLTQTKAAAVLGVDQPKVSALLRGKLEGFSIDRLFRFLNALDRDVEIVIRPADRAGAACTRVITA